MQSHFIRDNVATSSYGERETAKGGAHLGKVLLSGSGSQEQGNLSNLGCSLWATYTLLS